MGVGLASSVAQRLVRVGLGGIPVIFITARQLKALAEPAKNLGAEAFFEEPYAPEELLAAVARGLKANSAECGENHPTHALC